MRVSVEHCSRPITSHLWHGKVVSCWEERSNISNDSMRKWTNQIICLITTNCCDDRLSATLHRHSFRFSCKQRNINNVYFTEIRRNPRAHFTIKLNRWFISRKRYNLLRQMTFKHSVFLYKGFLDCVNINLIHDNKIYWYLSNRAPGRPHKF